MNDDKEQIHTVSIEDLAKEFEPRCVILANRDELFTLMSYNEEDDHYYMMDPLLINRVTEGDKVMLTIKPWMAYTDERVIEVDAKQVVASSPLSQLAIKHYSENRKRFYQSSAEIENQPEVIDSEEDDDYLDAPIGFKKAVYH